MFSLHSKKVNGVKRVALQCHYSFRLHKGVGQRKKIVFFSFLKALCQSNNLRFAANECRTLAAQL